MLYKLDHFINTQGHYKLKLHWRPWP